MIIKVQISKTWQEKPFEPFNVQLGMESNIPPEAMSPEGVDALMKSTAEALQKTAEEIFAERKARA